MSAVATLPSIEEFSAKLQETREKVASLTVHEAYTIDDYPIGGSNRGKCKLWTEYRKGSGYRMCRSTTDKNGRWCNAKKSTYHDGAVIAVVTGEQVEKEAAWLVLSPRMIYLTSASWSSDTEWIKSPSYGRPNRKPRPYTMNGVPNELPADPPEVCDLWDVWEPAILELLKNTHLRILAASGK